MKHLHLVAKDEDLKVPAPLIFASGDDAKDAAQDEVEKGEQHPRPTERQAETRIGFFDPHRPPC